MLFTEFIHAWDGILLIVLAAFPVILGWIYYQLITRRNAVQEALGSIDVHMKQRLDLVPNILRLAQNFMTHERSLLDEITRLRAQMPASSPTDSAEQVNQRLAAENAISSKMGQLMVQVENYPDLKSDKTMIHAMTTYNEIEGRIAASRRFYNSAITDLNNTVQVFPGNLVAKAIGIEAMPNYAAEEEARESINVDDYMTVGSK